MGKGYQGMDDRAWQEGTLTDRSGWIWGKEADQGLSLSLIWEHGLIRTPWVMKSKRMQWSSGKLRRPLSAGMGLISFLHILWDTCYPHFTNESLTSASVIAKATS